MGIGCLNATRDKDSQDPIRRHPCTIAIKKGNTRLLQILISESAHLIWVLRCERIQGKTHSDDEIRTRWLRKINERLTCDWIAAMEIVRNKTYTKLIKNTWKKALQRHRNLQVN